MVIHYSSNRKWIQFPSQQAKGVDGAVLEGGHWGLEFSGTTEKCSQAGGTYSSEEQGESPLASRSGDEGCEGERSLPARAQGSYMIRVGA